jgi:single-stranded DNA-binding protein
MSALWDSMLCMVPFLQTSESALHTYLDNTMSAANNGNLVGTIVSDIVTKNPNDSLSVTQFRVAPLDAREEDSPLPVIAYNGIGDNMAKRYNKGDTVALTTRLRYVTWMTPEGEPRGRMEVIVTSVNTVRLGQISTAQRAAEAAGVIEANTIDKSARSAAAATTRVPYAQEPTAEVVPF